MQELNCRLAQYLNRTKQLEQENATLIREISQLRSTTTAGAQCEPRYKAEMRDLRRALDQLSLEKSQAEMAREQLWRELQTVRSLCEEQTGVCRDITGELRGREEELGMAHKTNEELQHRLVQLERECARLEDAHRLEMDRLRRQVESRTAPPVHLLSSGPQQSVSVEDVQEFAFGLSDGWVKTFDMYQQKVEEMERAVREDQTRLRDMEREKTAYAAELDRIRAQAQQQGQVQVKLEQELAHMHHKFQMDCGEYQMIIDELQREREMMAHSIEQKMEEHEQLLKHKMDLGLELAAYRALLEGERVNLEEAHRRQNLHQRERIIEIKRPPQPYSSRASSSTLPTHTFRSSTATSSAASSYRRPPVPGPTARALSPSRVIPISVTRHQSPAARRDMISFTKARAAQSSTSSTTSTTKDKRPEFKSAPKVAQINSQTSKVQSREVKQEHLPTQMSSKSYISKTKEEKRAFEDNLTNGRSVETGGKATLDNVSVEDIIEKVIKPAGLEAKASDDTKVRYHIQKIQQEDGSTKTQIVLESKVEEELDISKDSDLEELMHQGVRKVSLEDIKDTATASMIKNLLSGVKGGEDLANKSINVEIIEEPVDTLSDDEEMELKKVQKSFQQQAESYFQIEELENAPTKATSGLWREESQVEEASRESDLSFMSQEKEPREYFVSTPDDFSEPEEGCGITSYGHYGIVDDLSDERYYQDEMLPPRATPEESEEYKYVTSDRPSFKEGFPECIIEEEVRVSPIVQESVLEYLREDSLEPKEQLKGALEKLQDSVSGPLKEELAYLAKISRDSPDKVAVDVRKLEQSSDDGTMTIVAELNVSQTLEESGLLDDSGDLSEEQIMAALRGAGLEKALQSAGSGGYSIKVTTEDDDDEGFGGLTEKDIMERFVRGETSYSYHVQEEPEEDSAGDKSQSVKVKEQRIVYLESPTDD